MFKNVATKVALFIFNVSDGTPKTGDAANLTAYVSKDYGTVTVLADTSATEMDSTNAPGWYLFDVAQAETNADALLFTAKSSTSGVKAVGQMVYTRPNRFTSLVIDAAGLADATAVKVGPTGAATAQTARDIGASVLLSPGTGTGQLSITSGVVSANVTAMAANTLTASALASDAVAEIQSGIATSSAVAALQSDTDDIQSRLPAALVSGRIDASVGAMAANVLTATAIAADAITDAKVASDVTIASVTGAVGSVTGAVGSVTGNVGGNVTGSVGSVVGLTASNLDATISSRASAADLATVAGYIDTEVAAIYSRIGAPAGASIAADIAAVKAETAGILTDTAEIGTAGAGLTALASATNLATVDTVVDAIKGTTDKLDDTLEDDGGTYRFTANALEEAPSGGGGGTDWDADERTAIRTILGIPTTGTTPDDPTSGILDAIRDGVAGVQSDTNDIQSRIPASLTGDGNMKADMLRISGSAESADRLEQSTLAIVTGTVASGATTTSIPTSALSPAGSDADQFKGRIISFSKDTTTAALRGQSTDITASSASGTPTFTVTALTAAPASGDTFVIT